MRAPQYPMIDWDALRQDRLERLTDVTRERRLDALLLTMFDNVRYATGMAMPYLEMACEGQFCLVVPGGDTYVFSTDGTSVEPVADPDPRWPHVRELVSLPAIYPLASIQERVSELFVAKLSELKARCVGFDSVPAALHAQISEALRGNLELVDVHEDLFAMRLVKHPEELRIMQANAVTVSAAARTAKAAIRAGARERDVAAAAVAELYRDGETEWISHMVLDGQPDCCDEPALRPLHHRAATDRPILEGETACFDMGHYGLGGYCTDIARTAAAGQVAPRVEEAYERFVDVYLDIADGLRDGVRVWDHVGRATQALTRAGLAYDGALGHGIGLRSVEPPSMSRQRLGLKGERFSAAAYRAGSVMCLEMHPSREGYRFSLEDMFLVTEDAPIPLTTVDYRL